MKAAAYARYSTDKQTDNSIAYQMAKIYEYCARNDITVSTSYADEALSGTNTEDRVEFLKMLGAASNKEFEAVVIYDITRGSRDVGDWFNFRKAMSRLNIKVIAVEDKLGDILNPNDFLVELINVGIAWSRAWNKHKIQVKSGGKMEKPYYKARKFRKFMRLPLHWLGSLYTIYFQVPPRFKIIPPKARKVLHQNEVYYAVFYVFHHFQKALAVEISAACAVVYICTCYAPVGHHCRKF
ncbi:MAG: recombinase family protein [Defluviitaleaceae bacterium]|nr:recombinase family protein [Defluviitaleaceae bacterium]